MSRSTASRRSVSSLVLASALVLGPSAAAAATEEPAASPSLPDPACKVDMSVGVPEADALAVEMVVCGLFAEHAAPGLRHRVRLARIGGKVVVTVASAGAYERPRSKQLVLTSLDEITVAAPRLLEAATEDKTVAETETVANVVGEETRKPKKRTAQTHFWLGMIGASAPGIGTGGGADMALSIGSDRWSIVTDFRVAGESFNRPAALAAGIFTLGTIEMKPRSDFAFVGLSAGPRAHFSSGTIAPFAGAGFALAYLGRGTAAGNDTDGTTGLAGYGELGVDFLRSSSVGGAVALRADVPAFAARTSAPTPPGAREAMTQRTWAPVLGGSVMFRF